MTSTGAATTFSSTPVERSPGGALRSGAMRALVLAAHDASLTLPETREAIGNAMRMLTGEFTSQEVSVVGGLGV